MDRFADRNDLFMIDILKIDTEGYEPHVFEGIQKLLKNHRIRLFIFEHLNGRFVFIRIADQASFFSFQLPFGTTRLYQMKSRNFSI